MVKQQFLKFITIGVLSTIVNYTIFYALYRFLAVDYVVASGIGFVSGVFAGYGLNKNWTFGVKEKAKQYVYKYYIVYIVSLFLGLGFLEFLVVVLGIIPELANALTIILTTCTNFIGVKFWVFKK